jgi:uncharacterized membrane protein
MSKWTRILKHRWLDERDVLEALGPAALHRLEERVAASEKKHSGEVRVCVEAGLPFSYLWKNLTPRDRAIAMFGKLRVWDTERNNGVLIYLLLADHAIEIVADRGLNAQVSPAEWQAIVDGMREAFRAGRFEVGLNAAVDAVDALLEKHFPARDGEANINELPNRPWIQ